MDKKYFGLYKGHILFYTTGGSFASDAWIASGGKDCGDIAGNSFMAFTADDGEYCNIGARNVSPITEEKLNELFEKAHPALKLIYMMDERVNGVEKWQKWQQDHTFCVQHLLKEYSFEDVKDYLIKEYCL
nr:MAG TPA: hypothetical protein [Bacteriophage sp.]